MKIIRRIFKLPSQTRFNYILIEVSLLGFGVLLALGANSLRVKHYDKKKAENYLSYLVRDLEINKEMLNSTMDFNSSLAVGIKEAIHFLNNDSIEASERIYRGLSSIGGRRTLTLHNPTYLDLLNTGNLSLFKNYDLRDAIIIFYQNFETTVEILQLNNEKHVDGVILTEVFRDNDIGLAISEAIRAAIGFSKQDMEEQDSYFEHTQDHWITYLDEIRSNPFKKKKWLNMLEMRVLDVFVSDTKCRELNLQADELLERIEEHRDS